jgi:hypothetical protein
MGRPYSSNPTYINITKVTDEAWIAQRATKSRTTWYLLKLGDKRPRCSLGTDDKRHAALLTMKAYQAWLEDPNSDWRSACGNVAHHIGFQQVTEDLAMLHLG